MSVENIRKLYKEMSADRGYFNQMMVHVQDHAQNAQQAFNDLAKGNSDLGAGVILPILRCITSHVITAATNPDHSGAERWAEVADYLAPMIAMHYDMYTRECLENIDTILNDVPSEGA
ncbi:hypothetical protein SAMN05720781_2184 [Fibrobacter sp. UWT3]|uniref:hypothetical protein n=1 Tax=Fibrobacter sp. UWT3 TaxID=1896225 RepID=UPI000BC9614B|nr:hypothetical protein [Fibrobacter sp. UWT3]SOE76543.1 hypothetical protein SAMN05720781_2184 [Fibrobacter sp. UWT3]